MKKMLLFSLIVGLSLVIAIGFCSAPAFAGNVNLANGDAVTVEFWANGLLIDSYSANIGSVLPAAIPDSTAYYVPPQGYVPAGAAGAKWFANKSSDVLTSATEITDNIVANGKVVVTLKYVHQITFLFADGNSKYAWAEHGKTVMNVPAPPLKFGQSLSYDRSKVTNVTSNQVVLVEIKDFALWIFIGGGVGIAVIIILVWVIAAHRSDEKDEVLQEGSLKQMITTIKQQDKRIEKLQAKRFKREEESRLRAETEKQKNKTETDDFDEFLKKV